MDNQFNFQLFKTNATDALALSAFFNITDENVDQYGRLIPATPMSGTASSATGLLPSSTVRSTMTSTLIGASPTMKSVRVPQVAEEKAQTKVIVGVVLGVVSLLGLGIGIGVWLFRWCNLRKEKMESVRVRNVPRGIEHSTKEYCELKEGRREDWKALPELNANEVACVAELPS